jgi:hypothetical protein
MNGWWLLLVALLLGIAGALGYWRRDMTRSDWWALLAYGVLLGSTLGYMLWVGTQPT